MKWPRGPVRWLVVSTLIAVVLLGIYAVVPPWGFFMGGRFRLNRQWQGWGQLHADASGGDYALYVRFWPVPGQPQSSTRVYGDGLLCTSRGERFALALYGNLERRGWIDTNGTNADLNLENNKAGCPPCFKNSGINLRLRGQLSNAGLTTDDQGELSQYFGPDGRYLAVGGPRPGPRATVQVVLHEGSKSEWEAACPEISH